MSNLLVIGLGYTGGAVARAAAARGWKVAGTHRAGGGAPEGVEAVPFMEAVPVLARATHLLVTAPPDEAGDPVLARFGAEVAAARMLRWIGYLSTTGIYGDRGGGWVDEDTPPAPGPGRARRRMAAEQAWAGFAGRCAVDILRLAGIYGPGRSPFGALRTGVARRILKPGQFFGRIHRDDIVRAVLAAMGQERGPGLRLLNLADDTPAGNAEVVEEAARLLGVPPPPAIPYEQAAAGMSDMARSFWAENRRVSSARTQDMLGLRWRYPSYREGLRAILAEEAGQGPA